MSKGEQESILDKVAELIETTLPPKVTANDSVSEGMSESKPDPLPETEPSSSDKSILAPPSKSLRELLSEFPHARSYGKWFFNAVRIRNWHSHYSEFEELSRYSTQEIDQELKRTVADGEARVNQNGLYSAPR